MNILKDLDTKKLLEIVTSEKNQWQGFGNNDTIALFQARSAIKLAACLILSAIEIEKDDIVMNKKEALIVLENICNIDIATISQMSGTHGFHLKSLIDSWKSVHFLKNPEINNQ